MKRSEIHTVAIITQTLICHKEYAQIEITIEFKRNKRHAVTFTLIISIMNR